MIKPLLVLAVSIQLGVMSAAADAPKIERIAPKSSIIVISVDNWQAMTDHLKATPMWGLWESPDMAGIRKDFIAEYEKAVEEMFTQLGVDGEELPLPTGAAGLSVFVQIDEELGIPQPGMIAFADFGENADKLFELYQAALKRGEEDGELEFEDKEVLGRTMTIITMKNDEQPQDEFEGDMDMNPLPDPGEIFGDLEKLHVVREGTSMMICSHELIVTDALEAIDGKDISSVASNREYQRLVSRLGASDAHAILLSEGISRMMPPEIAMMGMGDVFKLLLGDIAGAGVAMKIDQEPGTVVSSFFVSMPNGKSGLPALMDTMSQRGSLPAFISPDALSYGHANFEFEGLWPLIRKVINATPLAMQVDAQQMAQIEQTATQITSAMGTEMHSMVTATRPLSAAGQNFLYAIQCVKPDQINALLAQYAPMMQIEPRDFLGHTIYSLDTSGMMPGLESGLSMVTAGGFAFIGTTPAVEQSLRSLGGDAAPGGEETELTKSLRALPDREMVSWGCANLADQIILQREVMETQLKAQIEQWKEWDPELAKDMEADLARRQASPWAKIDGDVLRRHVGPMVWFVSSTDDGFEGTMTLLPP